MASISKAGYGLLKFVRAVLGYCAVYRIVKPKKDLVDRLQNEYNQAKKNLAKLYDEIQRIENELSLLNEEYNRAMRQKTELQEETETMQRRLITADKLISGLSSEQKRWNLDLQHLFVYQKELVGDCLLCSSFMSYTGICSANQNIFC